jgi:hypothetical protein
VNDCSDCDHHVVTPIIVNECPRGVILRSVAGYEHRCGHHDILKLDSNEPGRFIGGDPATPAWCPLTLDGPITDIIG